MKVAKATYGANLKVDGKVLLKVSKKNAIELGEYVTINSSVRSNLVGITNPTIIQLIENGRLIVGNHCGFSSTVFSSRSRIVIGDHVKIGANVRIFDHDYHSLNYLDRRNKKKDGKKCKSEPVTIHDDVFIGTNAIILKGVEIGARSIVGAGSVVSLKKIPCDSLVAGNPAVIIN